MPSDAERFPTGTNLMQGNAERFPDGAALMQGNAERFPDGAALMQGSAERSLHDAQGFLCDASSFLDDFDYGCSADGPDF